MVKVNKNIFDQITNDYIVQELLYQHRSLSILNESSVNIIRIVTVFINDTIKMVTAALRIGGEGDFTDNVEHEDGSGMTVVGIKHDGSLLPVGYHSNGQKVYMTYKGILFKDYKIPKFHEMISLAIREHTKYPRTRFIAWDFTLDENEEIIVMEYNTKSPGVLYYQYVNGPLFGEYIEEILNFVAARKGR